MDLTDTTEIDLGVDMDTNIVKKKCYFYILSNT